VLVTVQLVYLYSIYYFLVPAWLSFSMLCCISCRNLTKYNVVSGSSFCAKLPSVIPGLAFAFLSDRIVSF